MLSRERIGAGREEAIECNKITPMSKAGFSVYPLCSPPPPSSLLLPQSGCLYNAHEGPSIFSPVPPSISTSFHPHCHHWSRPPPSIAWSLTTAALLFPCLQLHFSHSLPHRVPWDVPHAPTSFPRPPGS